MMKTKSVSWNQIVEDIRGMWRIYWSITDPVIRKDCERSICEITDTMNRMHGMIDEEITNRN